MKRIWSYDAVERSMSDTSSRYCLIWASRFKTCPLERAFHNVSFTSQVDMKSHKTTQIGFNILEYKNWGPQKFKRDGLQNLNYNETHLYEALKIKDT